MDRREYLKTTGATIAGAAALGAGTGTAGASGTWDYEYTLRANTRGHLAADDHDVWTINGHDHFGYDDWDGMWGDNNWKIQDQSDVVVNVHGIGNTASAGYEHGAELQNRLYWNGFNAPCIAFLWESDRYWEILEAADFWEEVKEEIELDNDAEWDWDRSVTLAGAWGAATKLASLLCDLKHWGNVDKVHLVGHSLGVRVVLDALYHLHNGDIAYWNDNYYTVRSVHLLAGAVNEADPIYGEPYYNPIYWETDRTYNYFNVDDWILDAGYAGNDWWFGGVEDHQPLGLEGSAGGTDWTPENYWQSNASSLWGEDHFIGYWLGNMTNWLADHMW